MTNTPKVPTPWHARAWANPEAGFESAVASIVRGMAEYADTYRARYQVPIASDPVLAYDWLGIARGALALLDGDTGRFDCPTLDGLIRLTAERAGFTLALEARPGTNVES